MRAIRPEKRERKRGTFAAGAKSDSPVPSRLGGLVFVSAIVFSVSSVISVAWAADLSRNFISPPPPYRFPLLSAVPPVPHDVAKFGNGDRLSGTLKGINGTTVTFGLDLIGLTAQFPIENFSELLMTGPPDSPMERADAIYLRDGGFLSAKITGLAEDCLKAETIFGQAISVPKGEVRGIGLYRAGDVLFESDFSRPQENKIVPVLGNWAVEKGQLVQRSPIAPCRAYIPIVQRAVMAYQFSVDISQGRAVGLAFFASRPDTRFGGPCYLAMLRDSEMHFYRVIAEARHEAKRERIASSGKRVQIRIEYDPRSGEIVLWTGKDVLMRLGDADPIQQGQYVLFYTEGPAAFDDVTIVHLVGTIQGSEEHADLDAVILSNGDRVSGRVAGISEKVALENPYTAGETLIDRATVRSVLFAAPEGEGLAESEASPKICLWNGDMLFGKIVGMDERTLMLNTALCPELLVDRAGVRAIAFPRARSSALPAGAGRRRHLLPVGPEDETEILDVISQP